MCVCVKETERKQEVGGGAAADPGTVGGDGAGGT